MRLLECRDEGKRREEADMRIDPARERFKAAEISRERTDDRLIINVNPMLFNRFIEMVNDVIPHILVDGMAAAAMLRLGDEAAVDLAFASGLDAAPGKLGIADAARAREETDGDVRKAVLRGQALLPDFRQHALPILEYQHVLSIVVDVAAPFFYILAFQEIQQLPVGIEHRPWLLRPAHVKTAGEMFQYVRGLMQ